MPKQISIDQTAKLYNIMGGNIPLAAVRQDIRGWEGFERRVLTRAAEMSVQDWQKDYRKKLADDYMARAQGYTVRQSALVEQDRTARINREAAATNRFYQAMDKGDWSSAERIAEEYSPLKDVYKIKNSRREAAAIESFYKAVRAGDWETAKNLTNEYAPLRDIYINKYAEAYSMKWFIDAVLQEAAYAVGVQCVAFIGNILNAYYGENVYTGVGSGATGHGKNMLTRIVEGNTERYTKNFRSITQMIKNSNYQSFQFGDLVQLPGATPESFGHVMMFVGYTSDGRMKFAEATGGVNHINVQRWRNYSPEMYETRDGDVNLRQHIQIYDKDYFAKREENGLGITQVLRMRNLNFDYNKAEELLDFMLPSGTEEGGGYKK